MPTSYSPTTDTHQSPRQQVMESLYGVAAMLSGCKLMCERLNGQPEDDEPTGYELGILLDLARSNLLEAVGGLSNIQDGGRHE
jgi:hypothetical protein